MSFNTLKNLRVQSGNVYSFDNYKIYMIPSNKLKLGISPLIDKFINKDLDLSIYCKTGAGESISNKYIYEILKKKDTIFFFVTQTIISDKEIWEDEELNEDLIEKLQSMDLTKNVPYFNKIRTQLGLPTLTLIAIKFSKKSLPETIDKIRQSIPKKNRSKSSSSDSSRKRKNQSKGGGFVTKSAVEEHVISFMFIEKKTPDDFYIKVRCTTKIIDFAGELPEYKFPWATYFLYIFLKSLGNKHVNIYNDASNEGVIYYHKRFLFNLGKKKCSETEEIYDTSLTIPFNILRGPDARNKRLLKELIESLPSSYKTKSGFGMKICDIQNEINTANIAKVEEYLKNKWDITFNLPRLSISKKSIRSRSPSSRSPPSKRRRSFSKFSKTNSTKSKKLSRRRSYSL